MTSAKEASMSRPTRIRAASPSYATAGPSLRDDAKAMFRQAVLDAAERVFAEQGVHGARIQDIAKLARVSVGTVYNHFAQKEDIIAALLADRDQEFLVAFAPGASDPADFEGAFRARTGRMTELILRHRAFFAFALYEGLLDSDVVPKTSVFAGHRALCEERFPGLLEALLQQGMEEGVVERQDPVRLKHFISGAMRGVILAALRDANADPAEHANFAIELCLRAMRPVAGIAASPKKRRSEG